ncbi:Hypothetical protein GLP15_633 [Giardia lamblia P15]|uniref:Uncharacterized protein n=1 Tax=Giardia intestinalis (strain P15) TaxID=658858 RepID=E1F599_GIAIA|nr:Hypothetical protein GLP15_633 [Giardia lamblia P15]
MIQCFNQMNIKPRTVDNSCMWLSQENRLGCPTPLVRGQRGLVSVRWHDVSRRCSAVSQMFVDPAESPAPVPLLSEDVTGAGARGCGYLRTGGMGCVQLHKTLVHSRPICRSREDLLDNKEPLVRYMTDRTLS